MSARRPSVLLFLVLGACRVGPEYEAPEVEVPESWGPDSSAAAAAEPPERWWEAFHDPDLDSLISRAVAANLDLALARARVREARALRDMTAGASQPEIGARASASRSQASANTRQGSITGSDPTDLYDAGFDASWELDLFGSIRHAVDAAEAGVEIAEEERRDALVSLLGEVAREYVELRGSQRQVAIMRANVEAQRQTLELTRARFEAGLSTELDVSRSQALLANTQASIPSLEAATARGIHRLSVLLGEAPRNLSEELAGDASVPEIGAALTNFAAGLPSDLLRRRPDVRRTERELAQATSLTAEATANLYPKLTLGASLGLQSIQAGDFFDGASQTWSVGGSLWAPLFAGDRLRAAVRVQDARQEQALVRYQQTVLGALEEVETSLVSLARERERRAALAQALDASRRSLELANDLHLRGLADFFEVLDAQRAQLLNEADLTRSDTAIASDTVALYKSLGGGWETLDEQASAGPAAPGSSP
ncbi:MAG: efflux transporter outer membrane subunit [Planctomycetota bacterium]